MEKIRQYDLKFALDEVCLQDGESKIEAVIMDDCCF